MLLSARRRFLDQQVTCSAAGVATITPARSRIDRKQAAVEWLSAGGPPTRRPLLRLQGNVVQLGLSLQLREDR